MSLFLRLLELDIFAVGTVKTSVQGFPKKLKISPKEAKITSRGTCTSLVAATAKGPITAFCWMDSKPVYGISTGFMNRPVFIKRRVKKTLETFDCIEPLVQYQANMGGVDLNEFLRQSLYCVQSKVKFRKWYKMCFAAALDMAVTNSYILWKKIHHKSTHHNFLESLCNQLLTLNLHEGIQTRTYAPKPVSSVCVNSHELLQYQPGEGYNGSKRNVRDCMVCKRSSSFYCGECEATVCNRVHPERGISCWNAIHSSPSLKAKVERKQRRKAQASTNESAQEKRLREREESTKKARRRLMSP